MVTVLVLSINLGYSRLSFADVNEVAARRELVNKLTNTVNTLNSKVTINERTIDHEII